MRRSVEYIAVTHLPGGGPVAVTERDGLILVYLSEQYDTAALVAALNATWSTDAMEAIRMESSLTRLLREPVSD